MTGPIGESQANRISSSSDLLGSRWLVLGLIFGAGMLAVFLHESLRWPMKVPGRHGLELMAILLFVRCASGERYAATLASLGGATLGLVMQHDGGVGATILLMQGLALDGVYALLFGRRWILYVLPILAGVIHTFKPLVKSLYQAGLGLPSGSLIHGLAYPVGTHFLFGFVGGVVGVMAWRAMQQTRHAP